MSEIVKRMTDRLIMLQIGTCTCDTKPPGIEYHDEHCQYRMAVEVLNDLEAIAALQPGGEIACDCGYSGKQISWSCPYCKKEHISCLRAPAPVAVTVAWQPIELAPKDGTEVLLFGVPTEVPSLKPLISPGRWKDAQGFMAPGFWLLRYSVGPSFRITHWMPIPSDPTAALAAEVG